jgi:DNA-binding response OmpR family regulator
MEDGAMRILVIDDEALLRRMIVRFLRAEGFEVLEAACALEGIELHRAWPVDITLTDISLPDLDGIETARRIRASDPSARVLFMTGSIDDDVVEGRPVLRKPFQREELMAMIRSALKEAA